MVPTPLGVWENLRNIKLKHGRTMIWNHTNCEIIDLNLELLPNSGLLDLLFDFYSDNNIFN